MSSSISSDEEDESLAQFLESEVLLSHLSDQEEGIEMPKAKRQRLEEDYKNDKCSTSALSENNDITLTGSLKDNEKSKKIITIGVKSNRPKRIDSGNFSKIPPELFPHILKFLSSEDLISCSMVCKFLNYAASDEYLWHRLYCMRWGLLPSPKKLRSSAWKKLYIQRDEEDMAEFVRSCPPEFKEYFIQMQVAKRSHAPLPSQVNDDRLILDKTVADQVSMWKNSKGLTDKVVTDHACSGKTCSMYQIGDVFICENSGQVHVCDDNCREHEMDPTNELFVCTISGRCFDRLLLPDEMEPDTEQQEGTTDEAEPFMGSGRIARAYLLGYNCADEKELEAALKYC